MWKHILHGYFKIKLFVYIVLFVVQVRADMRDALTILDDHLDQIMHKVPVQFDDAVVRKQINDVYEAAKKIFESNNNIDFAVDLAFAQLLRQAPARVLQMAQRLIKQALPFEDRHTLPTSENLLLGMCTCHPYPDRIFLIIKIVLDVERARPDKSKPLVYTSLASGDLLQDYLALLGLIESGYHNITVNIIDPVYPDFTKMAGRASARDKELRELQARVYASDDRELRIKFEHLRSAYLIEAFKTQIEHEFFKRYKQTSGQINVVVRSFDHPDLFQSQAKKYPEERSDVFAMVDPGGGQLPIEHTYITQANVLMLKVHNAETNQFEDVVQIALPHYGPVQLYAKEPYVTGKLDDAVACFVAQIKSRPTKSRQKLMEMLIACKLIQETMTKEGIEQYAPTEQVVWESNAFLSFQDMLYDATKPDAVVYQYYAEYDVESEETEKHEKVLEEDIFKINIEQYKKSDVIQNTFGKLLAHEGYRKIGSY